jgi:hypothetical protein
MPTATPDTKLDPRFSSEGSTAAESSAARDHPRDAMSYQ